MKYSPIAWMISSPKDHDKIRPNILNTLNDDYKEGLSIPGSTFWKRKKE